MGWEVARGYPELLVPFKCDFDYQGLFDLCVNFFIVDAFVEENSNTPSILHFSVLADGVIVWDFWFVLSFESGLVQEDDVFPPGFQEGWFGVLE